MPINNITQTISTIPPAGARGVDVQTIFVTKQEDFQDHLQGTTVTELNTLKDQLNTRIGEINSTATTMNRYVNDAFTGASTATTKAGEASTSASGALTSRNQAETFKNNASASATKASQWADNNYNEVVEVGRYSAKHWSIVAQNATVNKVDKVTSTDNAIVRFDGTTGAVQNSGVVIGDNGNVGIGDSNPLYQLSIFQSIALPSTAGSKITSFSKCTNVGNASCLRFATVRITAGNTHYTSEERIQKVVDDTEMGYVAFGVNTVKFGNIGGERALIDSAGNLLLTSGSGALGYGTGSGGTVTQLTSKSTSVTLNKPTGEILMHNAALAAGASVIFIINNSLVGTYDTSIATVRNGNYDVKTTVTVDGVIYVKVTNISGVSLSESVAINFAIIKGANT